MRPADHLAVDGPAFARDQHHAPVIPLRETVRNGVRLHLLVDALRESRERLEVRLVRACRQAFTQIRCANPPVPKVFAVSLIAV